MSHRTLDPHHVRDARHYLGDGKIDASARALDAIAHGTYKRDRAEHVAPDGEAWESSSAPAVHDRLRRGRIAPHALAVRCAHAEPGSYCWARVRGLCGARVTAAASAFVAALAD